MGLLLCGVMSDGSYEPVAHFNFGGTMDRQRRSAKDVMTQYFNELKARPYDPETMIKIKVVETIASRMGWVRMFEEAKFFKPVFQQPRSTAQADLMGGGSNAE